ncbi:MAG: alpha/beta hydrolase [Myxococcota bacterium]
MIPFAPRPSPWVHKEAVVNGVRLHYVDAGVGPLVLLLHGFPDFWYTWRRQIPALVAAGFRVVAPDLRGYNVSDKPKSVSSYRMSALTGDIVGLISHLGEKRATLVGHDWGGAIAWDTALRHPAVVDNLVILNAPYPTLFLRKVRSLRQLTKSWYILFFQLPWLPEAVLKAGSFAVVERMLRNDTLRSDAFTDEDITYYKRALGQRGALTAMINYYRAAFHPRSFDRQRLASHIDAPTLLIWGEEDRFLDKSLTEGLEEWVNDLRVERIPHASHWVHADAPEKVNHLMVDFLQHQRERSTGSPVASG